MILSKQSICQVKTDEVYILGGNKMKFVGAAVYDPSTYAGDQNIDDGSSRALRGLIFTNAN